MATFNKFQNFVEDLGLGHGLAPGAPILRLGLGLALQHVRIFFDPGAAGRLAVDPRDGAG